MPAHLLNSLPARQVLRLPMRSGQRSLNLSNACAVAVFEAWRQMDYCGGLHSPRGTGSDGILW
ncbi:RNA methyltransferase, TrmH family, group 2 [Acidithiobacillus sp. GGI-221]|nr:RNA methyltransferase, TrmH family, group 2 [Acidithiobacillus sp. GGI-221]